jgi:AcrR family transcriptional regulator
MTRPSDYTRQHILKAAIDLFAERGFEGASVRAIVTKARVNQAAINYHFKGKEGLYLEVLKTAFDRFTLQERSDPGASPEKALRNFVSEQLRPLLARDEISRYIRIFAWESARPSKVLRKFLENNAAPFLAHATDLVRQFLPPHAPEIDVLCSAIWLMGQCSVFVRNREQFMRPPFGLKIDEGFVERLTDLITALALQGLTRKV